TRTRWRVDVTSRFPSGLSAAAAPSSCHSGGLSCLPLSASNTRTGSPELTNCLPSELKQGLQSGYRTEKISLSDFRSHIVPQPFHTEPMAKCLPSGLTAKCDTCA